MLRGRDIKKTGKRGEDSLNIGAETIGAGDRDRTCDLRFTKPLLYQLSYASNKKKMNVIIPKLEEWDQQVTEIFFVFRKISGHREEYF